MQTAYLERIEQDEALHGAIGSVLPALQQLTADQAETLVFYLKSLHDYYPASESSSTLRPEFQKKLDALGDSPLQREMQSKAARQMLIAMVLGGVAVLALGLAVIALLGGQAAGAAGLAVAAVALFIFAEARFGKPALVTAKEQDRRYFLESIRAARACNELDWSGLFTYHGATRPGPQSEADIERTDQRVAELARQLRAALYNDEFMQYTRPLGG
jgi:hypothetical protein